MTAPGPGPQTAIAQSITRTWRLSGELRGGCDGTSRTLWFETWASTIAVGMLSKH